VHLSWTGAGGDDEKIADVGNIRDAENDDLSAAGARRQAGGFNREAFGNCDTVCGLGLGADFLCDATPPEFWACILHNRQQKINRQDSRSAKNSLFNSWRSWRFGGSI
jgi:hypothetical protein